MEENRLKITRQAKIWGILIVGLILLGMAGFHRYYSGQGVFYSWLDCFYLSLQLIVMNSGGVSSPVPLQLNIARFALPMLAAYAFLSLIWFAFCDKILSIRLHRLRDHVIVCGLGRKGNFLARAYQAHNVNVVLIEKDQNNKHLEAYRQDLARAPVLIADASDETILRRAGVSKAKLLISTLGLDADNAGVADAARKVLGCSRIRERTEALECKIDVSDFKLWTLLRETEFERRHDAKPGSETFRLSFFNLQDSSARYLVNELRGQTYFNPAMCGGQQRIGIIGFNRLGELLILHIAREWSEIFRNHGKKITLFAWDKDIIRKIETIQNKYPIVKHVCDFSPFDLDLDNPLFKTITIPDCRDSGTVLHMPIYVCAEDQNVCVNLSMAAMHAYRELHVRIFALLSEDKGLLDPLNKYRGESGMAELKAVNLLEETCRPDVLDDGTHEELARIIHKYYLVSKGKDAGSQPWADLPRDEKWQNLNQALFIGDQLHSISCGITPWIEYGAESFQFTDPEIECMAEAEHKRWVVRHEKSGWKSGLLTDKANKIHSCLVSWTNLPEGEKDTNRKTIKKIPLYLAKAGFQIYRMRTTGSSAP